MSEFGVEGSELKKMIKAAKAAPVAFGFNPGKNEDTAYLGMHKLKPPAVIGKEAKEEGEGGKFAFGTATVVGKILRLTCEREMPGLAKRIKKHLKQQKVMLNVEVCDADGNVLESDIEDDLPDDPDLDDDDAPEGTAPVSPVPPVAPPAPPETGTPTVDPAALMKRLTGMREQIGKLSPEAQGKVAGPFKQLVDLVKGGDLARAAEGCDRLEAAIKLLAGQAGQGGPAQPQGQPPADPQLAKLAQLLAQMRGQGEALADERTRTAVLAALDKADGHLRAKEVEQVVALVRKLQEVLKSAAAPAPVPPVGSGPEGEQEGDEDAPTGPQAEWEARYGAIEGDVFVALSQGLVEDVGAFRTLNDYLTGLAIDGAWDKALAGLPKLEEMLRAGRGDGKSAMQSEVPPDARPFAEARILWSQARSTMRGEIGKVVSEIRAAAALDELLSEAVANVAVLTDNVERLDARLEDKLDEIVNAPADKRDALKEQARKLIAEYETELGTPFFQEIDTGSGFGSVAVTATARAALSNIARAIA